MFDTLLHAVGEAGVFLEALPRAAEGVYGLAVLLLIVDHEALIVVRG